MQKKKNINKLTAHEKDKSLFNWNLSQEFKDGSTYAYQ
jgi:hypothetical protein